MTTSIDPHHNHPTNNSDADQNHDADEGGNNFVFPSLGRQSSIYSLTLDEFQHALSDNGKKFGSMNMDEFLNSIWTAEENQPPSVSVATSLANKGTLAKQPSLPRQGSLTLPPPLCRKTVDEVWTEIQRIHQPQPVADHQQQPQQAGTSASTQRQPTFGEMTLEDFLIKAGVVREQCAPLTAPPAPPPPPSQHPPPHQYGFSAPQMGPTFVTRPPVLGGATYQPMPPTVGDNSGYTGNGKRNKGYPTPVVGCYGGQMSNGGGFVAAEGMCERGLDMTALRGRKRIINGPVEKVVERRQKRMIKNRESAARSRARKQAYTVELEAELNQLREENAQLKHTLVELEKERKQQYREEQNVPVVLSRAQRAQDRLRAMRRSWSCTI